MAAGYSLLCGLFSSCAKWGLLSSCSSQASLCVEHGAEFHFRQINLMIVWKRDSSGSQSGHKWAAAVDPEREGGGLT